MRDKNMDHAEELKAEVTEIKECLSGAEAEERGLDKALDDALAVIPNVPLATCLSAPTSTAMSRSRSATI